MQNFKPDIIAMSETWLKSEILTSEVLSVEYYVFRKDRPDRYGGVLIACHNSLNCCCLNINYDTEAITCQLNFDNHQTLVACAFYRSPNSRTDGALNLCQFSEVLLIITQLHPYGLAYQISIRKLIKLVIFISF